MDDLITCQGFLISTTPQEPDNLCYQNSGIFPWILIVYRDQSNNAKHFWFHQQWFRIVYSQVSLAQYPKCFCLSVWAFKIYVACNVTNQIHLIVYQLMHFKVFTTTSLALFKLHVIWSMCNIEHFLFIEYTGHYKTFFNLSISLSLEATIIAPVTLGVQHLSSSDKKNPDFW